MPSEILKLTTEIVVAHSSVTELTPDQLVGEIKSVYNVLASLDGGATLSLGNQACLPRVALGTFVIGDDGFGVDNGGAVLCPPYQKF